MKILKSLREAKGLTQQIVAQAIGVDRTTYVKYENGQSEPNFETAIKLAAFYDVSIDELVGYNTKKKPTTVSDDELDAKSLARVFKLRALSDEDLELLDAQIDLLLKRHKEK
jgi:hypothetical protein